MGDIRVQVGKALRRARHRKRWTMKQVAEHVGRDVATVFRYETGKFDMPLTMLDRFARLYGVTVASLADAQNALPPGLTRTLEDDAAEAEEEEGAAA